MYLNSSTFWMAWGEYISANFHFWVNHSFKFSLEEKLLVNADFNFVLFLIQSYSHPNTNSCMNHFYTIWFLPPILKGIQVLVYTDTVCYLCKLHWNYTVLLAFYTIINYITCQTKKEAIWALQQIDVSPNFCLLASEAFCFFVCL